MVEVQRHNKNFTLGDTGFSMELGKAVCFSSDDIIGYENNQIVTQFCLKC